MLKLTNKNALLEALKAGRKVSRVTLHSGARGDSRIEAILVECAAKRIPVVRSRFDRPAGKDDDRSRPVVIAECADFQYADLSDLFDAAAGRPGGFIMALDHVQDTGNLGAIIRTCAAAEAAGVIIEKHDCCGVTDAVADIASGGIEHVRIARVSSLAAAVETAKKRGFWIAGTDERAERGIWDYDFPFPLVILMGGEGKGLSRLAASRCDDMLRIPVGSAFTTLNVSVAAAVIAFEARRRIAGA